MATILVVDDHPTNRDVLLAILGFQGHRLLEAADGQEALEIVHDASPDLVICDILMPTMDGYEFVRRLREDPGFAGTPVIYYTAHYREHEARSLAAQCGVEQVLLKPVEPEAVLDAVGRALGSPPARDRGLVPETFDREHLRLVTDKLSEETRGHLNASRRLAALTELNLALASEKEPDRLLDGVCRGARELIGARIGVLEVRDKNGGEHLHVAFCGLADEVRSALQRPGCGDGPLGTPDIGVRAKRLENPGGKAEAVGLAPELGPVRAVLAGPVASHTIVYGWICVLDKVGADRFTEEDEHLLDILGRQVGRIYENGSLFRKVRQHALALEAETRALTLTQQRLAAQYAVSRVLADADDLAHAAAPLLDAMCRSLGFDAGTVWQVNPKEGRIRCLGAWTDGSGRFAHFAETSRQASFPVGQGMPGIAWSREEPVWVDDLWCIPPSPRSEAGLAAGLRSAVAFPITQSGHPIGVIDLFSGERRDEDPELMQALAAIGNLIGHFLERKAQQVDIARLNRIYSVLSQINSLIVRVRSRTPLFEESCRIAVTKGRFLFACISEFDAATGKVTPAFFASEDFADALRDLPHPVEEPVGAHLVRTAVLTGEVAIDNEVDLDEEHATASAAARSMIALPLVAEDRVLGVLCLGAPEPDFFNDGELELLRELAGDIAFALVSIDKADRLDYLARFDVLTGLPNRKELMDRLEQSLHGARRRGVALAVAVMDIRRFHQVNDTFGRVAGDQFLREFAARFVERWPDSECMARLGIDFFAGVIPDISGSSEALGSVLAVQEHLHARPVEVAGESIAVTTHAGIAMFPADAEDAQTLTRLAEAALARAKSAGERCVLYQPDMSRRPVGTLLLENRLRRALEQQQFVLHYQPKVDTLTRQLKGLEALIRWNDPERGLQMPAQFVTVLEETGIIVDVGLWSLRRAIEDARWLARQGRPVPRIAVNVSALQLQQRDFVESVGSLLAETGAGGDLIDLELTESMVMRDVDANIVKLAALGEMGVRIVIDDFGTGYSSLAYLARLPIHTLKIDRSFIHTMTQSPESMTIVSTIISLAHSMELDVIAEGVESEEEAKFLRLLKCDELQGFLFGKPMPMAEIARLPG